MSPRSNAQSRSSSQVAGRQRHLQSALRETIALQTVRIDHLQHQLIATQQQVADLAEHVATLAAPPGRPSREASPDPRAPDPLPADLARWLPVFLRESGDAGPEEWARASPEG